MVYYNILEIFIIRGVGGGLLLGGGDYLLVFQHALTSLLDKRFTNQTNALI